MRLRTFDELSPEMDAGRLLVHLSALGGAANRRAIDLWRRRSDLYADYVGVFAVEGDSVLGQTYVRRLAYTFPDGTETIAAIASVGTRSDRARRGVARAILRDVLRREKEAGLRYTALWTNPSWGAYRLYERLGYRPIHAVPWALRPPGASGGRRGLAKGVRPAWPSDLPEIEELHDREALGRIGFCRRPRRHLEILHAARELDPTKELLVTVGEGRLQGYAHLQSNPYRVLSGELVAESVTAERRLVAAIERRAGPLPVAVQGTIVPDAAALWRSRGYRVLPSSWWVLLAAPLGGTWGAREAERAFRTADPRFLCQSGDRF